ncbi:MAG: metallopeptidase TldD-related protein [Holdemanella biformis]|nr:metallopeptidase TldD-related protein [Holdemanella biformis]MEE0472654.1 metallopeptidase TldD-related protein [Holdemanella biformis]
MVTVANNFLNMMKHVISVGNDLDWSYHQVVSPSIAFVECTISGE